MVGDPKAVRFVASLLQHLEGLRTLVEVKRHRVLGKVKFLKPLRDTNQRHTPAQPKLVKHLDRR